MNTHRALTLLCKEQLDRGYITRRAYWHVRLDLLWLDLRTRLRHLL